VVRLSRARLVELGALASCILSHRQPNRTSRERIYFFWLQGSGNVLHGNGFAGLLQPIFFRRHQGADEQQFRGLHATSAS
jgi:hypothetical protein